MKKLTRERVVPAISASDSGLILGITTSGFVVLAEMRQQKKYSGQPLLAGVEQLVHQVRFIANVERQQVRDEQV
jgi:hypothetical protein